MSEIRKWYSGKNVFVTGATGFVGKCLIEKLLRDCDVGDVYIIIRNKKNTNFEQRKAIYAQHVVFSNLSAEKLKKIKIIAGDLLAPNLGISVEDRKKISENVSIIFHSAADVRFDRSLCDAYLTNVSGTKKMLDFAEEFRNLEVFVFVSTAFSQTHGKILEEKHYPAPIAPDLVGNFVDKVHPDILDAFTHKILGKFPNTYGFTKCLTEDLVHQYRHKFQIAIARPTIVITTWKEPLPGYTEGIHGINGWCIAAGRGALRTMHCQKDYPCNVVQADVLVNGMIVLAYERHRSRTIEPLYFNIAEGIGKAMSWDQYVDELKINFSRVPYEYSLWKPDGSFKMNRFHNFVCVILFHVVPALLIDLILFILRIKPFMLRVQRIIQMGCDALNYYLNHKFLFKTENYDTFTGNLNEIDRKVFFNRTKMSVQEYFRVAVLGTKLYLIKDKKENIPKAKAFSRRLIYLDLLTKIVFWSWIVYAIIKYFEPSVLE